MHVAVFIPCMIASRRAAAAHVNTRYLEFPQARFPCRFAARGQHPIMPSRRWIHPTRSVIPAPASRRAAPPTSILICIDVPRAGMNFRNFTAGGQSSASPAGHRIRGTCSCTRESPRSGGNAETRCFEFPQTTFHCGTFAAGGQHLVASSKQRYRLNI
ncbi:hypothetical protein C8R43DRAFT_340702 [Mycena crocata]|nr:hypothetical protein C8R43DRAFT_340702 [Mycena crocata]